MPSPETPTIDASKLTGITLLKGGHDTPDDGLCLMELVAFLRGLPHTDSPPCVSPVLGAMGRSLNDLLPDDTRQLLKPMSLILPGTAGDGHDEARSYLALDWLIRTWLPAWLDLSPTCRADAAKVRALGRIVDATSAKQAGPVVREAQKTSAAAWAAAWAAAGDAARAAARAAAWAAAWAAAGAAAWDAAGVAALAAALAAAGAAAWAAAWAAAGDAAGDALAPTVEALQLSAIELYREMATIGHDAGAGEES